VFLGEETQLFRNELCNFVFQTWKILLSIAQNFEMWAPYASSSSSSFCIFLNKFMLPFFVSLTISLEEPKLAVNFCRIYISHWESTVVGFLLCNWNQWMTKIFEENVIESLSIKVQVAFKRGILSSFFMSGDMVPQV